ncbi:sensor histidine kinase [Cohnella xylanilytica]|uniref:histidine kinase n=1 Tax=Cohnella xylanilytica TaxID=557555 RepID=A0A841U4U2_9BACL|nr:sensor histidine kinase [Cohnella xylanilytica]MBB6694128.1 sensor histidine kinase [Cohnella xylanilytica]
MTIRAKLLLVIPLLVLLADSVAFFLFQSTTVVQGGYDRMMDRLLTYKLTVQSAERSLQAVYGYLLDPGPETRGEIERRREERLRLRESLERTGRPSSLSSATAGFVRLLDKLQEQENAAMSAASSPGEALTRYETAERTLGFIREEGGRLVDLELEFDQPIFRRIQEENERMNRLGAAVIAVQTLLGGALAVWISRSVTGPVDRLVAAAKRVSEGRPQEALPALPANSRDELGILSGAFLQMLADLKASAERDRERLEQSRLVKELELRALQSQIHPHFLFNSLNVLAKLALLEGAEKTSDLIVSLSKMIRYVLRNPDEPVTLREELGHVAAYAAIQRARFGSRIRFETDADEEALSAPIPSLTIQPLVENAFVHGMERLERSGEIRLTVRRDGADAVVEIRDDGAGMDEQTRQALLRMDYETDGAEAEGPRSAGLGTRNVFRRIQLFSGRADAVDIRSEPGRGTTVTVRIPLRKEENRTDVPPVDRG